MDRSRTGSLFCNAAVRHGGRFRIAIRIELTGLKPEFATTRNPANRRPIKASGPKRSGDSGAGERLEYGKPQSLPERCTTVVDGPVEQDSGKAPNDPGMMPLIRGLLRPYRGSLAIILVSMLVQSTMTLAAPWPLKIIIDNVVVGRKLDPWLGHLIRPLLAHAHRDHLAEIAALAVILIAVLNALASYLTNYLTESVGQWVANDLRMRTSHHLQYLSLRYYDTHQSGVVLSTSSADVLTIQNFASSATLGIVIDMFTILGMLVVMFFLNWDFTLIAVGVTPLLLLLASRFKKAVKASTHEVRKQQSNIVAVVQQDLEQIRVVTAFGRQELEQQSLETVSHATVEAALKARRVKSMLSPIVSIIVSFCTGFVLWRGALLILANKMTAGELTVFLAYLASFFKPVKDLASMNNSIAATAVAVERVRTILDADSVLPEKEEAIEQTIDGEIEFDHVAFAYDETCPVLRDVSFSVTPGQMIGVVGPTGSGKSTIMSLIPRFYDPSAGCVKVDGTDVRDSHLQALRDQIGYVLQETVLFRGTVADNIAYGRAGATEADVISAAKLANADEFISRMPNGYDTFVGDRGDTLS